MKKLQLLAVGSLLALCLAGCSEKDEIDRKVDELSLIHI